MLKDGHQSEFGDLSRIDKIEGILRRENGEKLVNFFKNPTFFANFMIMNR